MAEMQDLVLGHALLAVQDQAVPGFDGLLRLGALRFQNLQLGVEPLAGELAVPFVLLDVPLHVYLARAAVLLASGLAALVVAVQVALYLTIPFKDKTMV